MELEIDFIDETGDLREEDVDLLDRLLTFAAGEEKLEGVVELSVTAVTNERIREINREYRGKDTPTDVISFALEEMGAGEIEITGEGIPRTLGDIIISVDRAKEQAADYGHSFQRELGFLAVHGLLHLLGYDHMNPEEEEEMFSRQREILEGFGLER